MQKNTLNLEQMIMILLIPVVSITSSLISDAETSWFGVWINNKHIKIINIKTMEKKLMHIIYKC